MNIANSTNPELPDRKRLAHPSPLQRVNHPTILFVTVCIANRRHLLNTDAAHQLLADTWIQSNRWLVGRYVLMPDHLHFFCAPNDAVTPFKAWMEYWRNMATKAWPITVDKPLWQRDFWDRQLRKGDSYSEKWNYVQENPVRAGLVNQAKDWPYQGELNVLSW